MASAEQNAWPEPAPDWPEAKKQWQWVWPLHVYGFASMNFLVFLYALYILVRRRKSRRKFHAFFMNLMLVLFGLSRCVVLSWDPYASKEHDRKTELVASVIAFGLGTAFITSAISLLLLLLIDTTRISLVPSRVQNLNYILSVTFFNVVYVLVTDITVAFVPEAKVMILICQVGFSLWGIFVSAGFAVVAYRLWRNLKSSREATVYHQEMARETKRIKRLVGMSYFASFWSFANFTIIIYVAFSPNGVYSQTRHVDIWQWFGLQTISRTTELVMCTTIFVIALTSHKPHNRVGTELQQQNNTKQEHTIASDTR